MSPVKAPPRPRTVKPDGKTGPPFILLEGEPKSRRSTIAALLSADPRVGETFWLEVGEISAHEYGAIPGVRYEILTHDGTFAAMFGQVCAVWEYARWNHAQGGKPVVLVIDTGSSIWGNLSDWVDYRNRRTDENKRRLAANPDAELLKAGTLWNDTNSRWGQFIAKLRTFEGIAVLICDGKEVSATGENGQPLPGGKKDWSVAAPKEIGHKITLWIRTRRGQPAEVIAAHKVYNGVATTVEIAGPLAKDWFSLADLVFDKIGYQRQDTARELVEPVMDAAPEDLAAEAIAAGTTYERLRELYQIADRAGWGFMVFHNERGAEEQLCPMIKRIGEARDPARKAAAPTLTVVPPAGPAAKPAPPAAAPAEPRQPDAPPAGRAAAEPPAQDAVTTSPEWLAIMVRGVRNVQGPGHKTLLEKKITEALGIGQCSEQDATRLRAELAGAAA